MTCLQGQGCFLPHRKGGRLRQTHTKTPEHRFANSKHRLLPKALFQRTSELSSFDILQQGQAGEEGIHVGWMGKTPKFRRKWKNSSCSWHALTLTCPPRFPNPVVFALPAMPHPLPFNPTLLRYPVFRWFSPKAMQWSWPQPALMVYLLLSLGSPVLPQAHCQPCDDEIFGSKDQLKLQTNYSQDYKLITCLVGSHCKQQQNLTILMKDSSLRIEKWTIGKSLNPIQTSYDSCWNSWDLTHTGKKNISHIPRLSWEAHSIVCKHQRVHIHPVALSHPGITAR